MKNKKSKNIGKIKIILIIMGIWWTIALLLVTLQAWGMSKLWWTIPVGLALAALCFYGHCVLARHRTTKAGRIIIVVYALINTIPLILQLIGLKEPGFDNLVAAAIGLGVLSTMKS